MKKNQIRSSKGITLISLVVTIIVLIVFTTVTLNMTIGENGLITKAKEVATRYNEREEEERRLLEELNDSMAMDGEEILDSMGIGWNLGNSLECYYKGVDYSDKTIEEFETYWHNPVVTKELIQKVINKGFDTIRIPVTWYQHMDSEGNIDKEWISRVKEVVGYAMDEDVVVILNIHHEQWLTLDESVSEIVLEQKLTKIWTQIANEFKDYDYKLIFEVLNEPRNLDAEDEWSGNEKSYELLNRLNMAAYNCIRDTGGRNKKRCILIPTYAAGTSTNIMNAINIPDDKYIIISLHTYDPYEFVSDPTIAYNEEYLKEVEKKVLKIQNFKKEHDDVGVVITETGVYYKDDGISHTKWMKECMELIGKAQLPCLIWDNGNAERRLINRETLEWEDEEYVNTIINTYKIAREKGLKTEINKMQAINETDNIDATSSTDTITKASYDIIDGIRHFKVKTTADYNTDVDGKVRFKFSDEYDVNSSGNYKFSWKIDTKMSSLILLLLMYFYDEEGNLLYTANYENIAYYVDGSKSTYELSKTYNVEGAAKVKIERFTLSSSQNGEIEFDLYDLKLTDGDVE